MRLIIKNKSKNQTISGVITSPNISLRLNLKINYQGKEKFFTELQKLLLKYYDVVPLSRGRKPINKLILLKIRNRYKTNKRGNSYHNKHTHKQACTNKRELKLKRKGEKWK